jgi:hypothetical protein
MSRRVKFTAFALVGLLAAAAVAGIAAYQALGKAQPFYAKAMKAKPKDLERASQRMESRASTLYSDAKKPGVWRTVFTADEVNGWLAVVLKDKYKHILPPEVVDPRVAFEKGKALVGYKYKGEKFESLISIEAEAYMSENDLAAVRFRRVWAGVLPLPATSVIEYISDAAKKLEAPIRWTEIEGDPLLLVPVENALSTEEEGRKLEKVEFHAGELLLTCSTAPRSSSDDAASEPKAVSDTAL